MSWLYNCIPTQRRIYEFMLVVVGVVSCASGVERPTASSDAAKTSCSVVGFLPLKRSALELTSQLSGVFADEMAVDVSVFGDLESAYLPSSAVGSRNVSGNVLLVYRYKPDRQCLLSQPKPPIVKVLLDNGGEAEKLNPAIAEVINVVNEQCGTYRTADGTLSRLGYLRKETLNRVFRVVSYPNATLSRDFVSPQSCYLRSKSDQKCNPAAVSKPRPRPEGMEAGLLGEFSSECERVAAPNKLTFVTDYLLTSRPVIIAGGVKHWRAFSRWTREHLLRTYGDKIVHVKLSPDGEYEGVERVERWHKRPKFQIPPEVLKKLPYPELVVVRPAPAEMKFSEFLDIVGRLPDNVFVKANASAYLEYSSLSEFPKLEEDIEELDFMRGMLKKSQTNIWLSDGNTLGKLHFDPFDNLLCQISGKKEVLLYEPHNNTQLYEAHIVEAQLGFDATAGRFTRQQLMDSTSMVMSPVDPKRPNLKEFPEFAHARPMKCVLNEGDVLYLPAFWWHEVQSFPSPATARNLAVNYWYEPFFTKEFPCPECAIDINPLYNHLLLEFGVMQ